MDTTFSMPITPPLRLAKVLSGLVFLQEIPNYYHYYYFFYWAQSKLYKFSFRPLYRSVEYFAVLKIPLSANNIFLV